MVSQVHFLKSHRDLLAQTAGLDFLPENLLAKLNCGIGLARLYWHEKNEE